MRRLLLLLVVPLLGLLVAAPAEALSCKAPIGVIPGADSVFTGTITSFDEDSGRVEVKVGEVWRGSDVPKQIRLHDDLPFWSSWQTGKQYLFAPRKGKEGHLTVNTCSAWTKPGSDRFREFRPAVVRQPGTDPTPIAETATATKPLSNDELRLRKFGAGAAAIVVVGGVIIFLRRKRTAATPGQGYSPETRPEDY